jgi:RNA polymerase sigma-70 factor (ECF subfamily)
MEENEDTRLVNQCLNGDRRAFETIIGKYQGAIFNIAHRMSHNVQDAEDIAQASFLKAYEKLGSYKPEFKFFSWIYRITINESINFLKHRNKFESFNDGQDVPETTAAEESELQEPRRILEESLMELKEDHRAVIVLKHFENLSYDEIGHVLGISEKKVKSRLFTARQVLRERLMKKGIRSND